MVVLLLFMLAVEASRRRVVTSRSRVVVSRSRTTSNNSGTSTGSSGALWWKIVVAVVGGLFIVGIIYYSYCRCKKTDTDSSDHETITVNAVNPEVQIICIIQLLKRHSDHSI